MHMPRPALNAADELAAATVRAHLPKEVLFPHFGIELVDIGAGRARFEMTVRADMLNAGAVCHGGMIFMLADSALGYAANSHDRICLTAGCTIDYLAPARLGDRLAASAEEIVRKRKTGLYDVRVTTADGTLIAMFRGRTVALDQPVIPPSEAPA